MRNKLAIIMTILSMVLVIAYIIQFSIKPEISMFTYIETISVSFCFGLWLEVLLNSLNKGDE